MSGFNAPLAVASAPKQMSGRLLNMKFMQRAAATTAQKSPSTPSSERNPKRRRTGDFPISLDTVNSPATPTSSFTPTPTTNGLSVRRGTNNFDTPGVETEWVLDINIPVVNGHLNGREYNHNEDESSDEDDDIWSPNEPCGRQTFGAFNKKKTSVKGTAGTETPSSTTKSARKRNRSDDEEGEISPLPSHSDFDSEESEGEINERSKGKNGKFDLKSAKGLKEMDNFDFQSPGSEHGFGRQRLGLSGGGGGGGGAGGGGGPGKGSGYGQSPGRGGNHSKKARKTM